MRVHNSIDPIGLVCSVDLEAAPLVSIMKRPEPCEIGRKPGWLGLLGGRPVVLLACGMGKTNAAQALAALLETRRIGAVIGFGVGGAYPGSSLEIGGIAVATAEIYGDEGVLTDTAWLSTREMGIPLVSRARDPVFNEIALEGARVDEAVSALRRAAMEPVAGPFVTVSTCSGTSVRGRELQARFGAVCETMEGAAHAHVCAIYETPYVGIRGISNLVEDRDLRRWRLEEAAAAAAAAVRVLVESP